MAMTNERRGRLFVISAPSGTGKSTIIRELIARRPELIFSVSATTRPPRGGEQEGVEYRFIAREVFDRMARHGAFLEYAEFVGNMYGTPKQPILEHLERGEDVILDIDVQGAEQVRRALPEAVLIFIAPPEFEELERRIRRRGAMDEETIRRRLERAEAELALAEGFDGVVVNDDVSRAADAIIAIMERGI
jgi:guanylate kinase